MLGNMKFISRVNKDISQVNTGNKFHISPHACIIYYSLYNRVENKQSKQILMIVTIQ